MLFHFIAHSSAGVCDADLDVIAGRNLIDGRFLFFGSCDGDGRRFQAERSAMDHRVAGVHDEVEDNLGELTWIDFRVGAVFAAVQMTFDRDVFSEEAQQRTFEIRDESINLEYSRREGMLTAKGEQLSGKNGRASSRIPDFADMVSDRAFHPDLIQEQVAVTENGSEEIIEVVGDTAGELAEGFHLLRTNELILELLSRGHVHQRPDELERP